MMEPCSGPTETVQIVNVFLNALTVCFTAWLVQRRRAADSRELNGKNGNGNGGPTQQRADGGFKGGHPPGIQP